jgi:hypothetical protein
VLILAKAASAFATPQAFPIFNDSAQPDSDLIYNMLTAQPFFGPNFVF